MKLKLLSILLTLLTILKTAHASSGFAKTYLSREDTVESKYLQISDSSYLRIDFYNNRKVKTFTNYFYVSGQFVISGYQYSFYENGRLNSINLYFKGEHSDFIYKQNLKGKLLELISRQGDHVKEIIQYSVINNANRHDEQEFITGNSVQACRYLYNIDNGSLNRIYEYTYTQGQELYNGIDLWISDGGVTWVRNYYNGKPYGMELYFNKRGKVFMFVLNNTLGANTGIKIKRLHSYCTQKTR